MKLIDDLNNLDPEMKKKVFEVVKLITEDTASDDAPTWYDTEKKKINEVEFCEWFIQKHPLKFVGGLFYDIDGLVVEYKLKKEIVEVIKPYIETAIAKRASQILEGLKYEAYCEELPKHIDRVHFKNGTFFLEGGFVSDKEFCSNRLPVKYNPDAKKPTRWLQFLDELLYPEDIPTLQEFMGYTFIPTTKAQAMLMLIGSGGEGKSRIGFVCRNLLGDNMTVCSVTTLSNNRFALASQEGMLLMVDDDMKMEALSDTGIIKSVVTMEDKMELERKGQQSYEGYLYVRIMVFGNGTLSALHDKSDGFYRRQIAIRVKEKPVTRVDDRCLSEKLAEETEGIALWCLEGLKRLVSNGFNFTISDRTVQNQAEMRMEEDSIMDFFSSEGYITFDKEAICSTKDLYEAYEIWAERNSVKPRTENSFARDVKQRAPKLGIEYLKNAAIDGRTARGYKGLYANHVLKDVPFNMKKGA